MGPGIRLGRVSQVSVVVGGSVMMGGCVVMVVMIEGRRVSVIGLGLTEQIVLLLLLLLIGRLLVAHRPVQLLLLLLLVEVLLLLLLLLLLVLLHLHLTLWRLVVAVPKRRWETPLSH